MGRIKEEVRNNHLVQFPEELNIIKLFQNGFDITWGKKRIYYNTRVSEYFLNPEPYIKDLFGFEQEILLIYAPYDEIQPRTIQAAEKIIESEPAKTRVEKYNYILLTKAENPQDWIDSYQLTNQDNRIIIAFNTKELKRNVSDGWYIRNMLSGQLYGRDLFDLRLPIKDDANFFGRKSIIMEYFDSVKQAENRGLFGLRKMGKTSLLFKIQKQLEQEDIARVIIYDCKSPLIRRMRWNELLGKICNDLIKTFKLPTAEISDMSIQLLDGSFNKILTSLSNRKFVIAFDEIEYLSPISLSDEHWAKDFVDFWQFMWSKQSIYKNFCFIIVGVNPYVTEVDNFNGIQNPLFGIVPHRFLQGLTMDELKTMIKTLGRKMGLKFKYDTYAYIHARYGGHPLLTRLACSLINKHVIENTRKPFEVTLNFLHKNEEKRDSELIFYCRHVVSELSQFYPEEYQMLEMLSVGQIVDFSELSVYPEFSKHLYDYGLLTQDSNGYPAFTIEAVKRYIGLENARAAKRKTIFNLIPGGDRQEWLKRRIDSITLDFSQLQKLIKSNSDLCLLFGHNSYPEADKFHGLNVCTSESRFHHFINVLNRCFVESIESYGRSINRPSYFWDDVKNTYSGLWYALRRIKAYRVDNVHLEMNKSANGVFLEYIKTDLEGKSPSQVQDLFFHLQQATLDGLLTGLQIEINLKG